VHKSLNLLILIDIALIASILVFGLQAAYVNVIFIFDIVLCAVLLFDFFTKLNSKSDRLNFFYRHFIYFVACIPLEIVLPPYFVYFRFLLLLKLLHLSGIIETYFENLYRFLDSSGLDRILSWIVFLVFVFTFLLYVLDPGFNLLDSLWFVMATLTTVGYGDVTPNNYASKIISLLLLIAGIFVFSTLTGAISSYFTDKVLNLESDVEDGVVELNSKVDNMDNELKAIRRELELSRRENEELKGKIDELLKR